MHHLFMPKTDMEILMENWIFWHANELLGYLYFEQL